MKNNSRHFTKHTHVVIIRDSYMGRERKREVFSGTYGACKAWKFQNRPYYADMVIDRFENNLMKKWR